MQSFEFTNDSFPLDKYFFPPADSGFASAASSSFPDSEQILLPSEIDLLFDLTTSAYHTVNFHGFTMDNHTIRSESSSSLPDEGPPPEIPITSPVRKTRRSEGERIKIFQEDQLVLSFGRTWVKCRGCGKTIKLDSRNGARYYPSFWQKHKKKCKGKMKGWI